WTDRDRQAWQKVEVRAAQSSGLDAARLTDLSLYQSTTLEMAHELATYYHPRAHDPFGQLTVPEILAVAELVSHDLAELVNRYVPGGRRRAGEEWGSAHRWGERAGQGYQVYSNVSGALAALFNPPATAARYAASWAGLSLPWEALQQNVLAWFYAQ